MTFFLISCKCCRRKERTVARFKKNVFLCFQTQNVFWSHTGSKWRKSRASDTDVGYVCVLLQYWSCIRGWFHLKSLEWYNLPRMPWDRSQSKRWRRPDWRRSNKSCSIQRNSRFALFKLATRLYRWFTVVTNFLYPIDVLWRQSQRPAAAPTRQRPSSRHHQTSHEKLARLPE